MKNEWKKHEKELYMPKNKPEIVTIPKQKYFMISGKGNPNNEEFSDKMKTVLRYRVKHRI